MWLAPLGPCAVDGAGPKVARGAASTGPLAGRVPSAAPRSRSSTVADSASSAARFAAPAPPSRTSCVAPMAVACGSSRDALMKATRAYVRCSVRCMIHHATGAMCHYSGIHEGDTRLTGPPLDGERRGELDVTLDEVGPQPDARHAVASRRQPLTEGGVRHAQVVVPARVVVATRGDPRDPRDPRWPTLGGSGS